MSRAARDLSGQRFGKLVALSSERDAANRLRWRCKCDCGAETAVLAGNLVSRVKPIRSCGCGAHPAKHGETESRLYQVWSSMHARCRSPSFHARKHYAAKGIAVCQEWQAFEPFRDWARAHGYADDLTLDRIDNDRGYNPDNCRFITIAEQQRNKGNHRMLECRGETLPLYQWAARLAVRPTVILGRLARGWPLDRALTEPKRIRP